MKREIIVNSSLVETRVAVIEDGTLVEILIDDSHAQNWREHLQGESSNPSRYAGRLRRHRSGQGAFLYVRDIYEDMESYEPPRSGDDTEPEEEVETSTRASDRPRGRQRRSVQASIEELIQEGQEVLVQVARGPLGTKGARITSHITLPGRYLVYMPTESHVGVSRKIEAEAERSRLKQIIEEINLPREGVIVRTAGVGRSKAEIQADFEFLRSTWRAIKAKAETNACGHGQKGPGSDLPHLS
jgi:ribonuclease G